MTQERTIAGTATAFAGNGCPTKRRARIAKKGGAQPSLVKKRSFRTETRYWPLTQGAKEGSPSRPAGAQLFFANRDLGVGKPAVRVVQASQTERPAALKAKRKTRSAALSCLFGACCAQLR